MPNPVYKHIKSGGLYELLGYGKLEENPDDERAIYKSLADGQVWLRKREEFEETTRFEEQSFGMYTAEDWVQHYKLSVGLVCEGFTLPAAARKMLETALFADKPITEEELSE